MNWINKLLRTPAAKPAAARPAPKPSVPPPIDDIEERRRALSAAANDDERKRTAADLGRSLAGLARAPQAGDPPDVWVAAICHVADKALALTWLASLEGDAWLGEVAIHGRISEVRLAALPRIGDAAVLEQVAQSSRDKDKRVYRHCADRLRQRRQADEDARRAVELAAALRSLLDIVPLHLSHLLELEKEVRALDTAAPSIAACNALLDEAHARLQQESTAQRDLQSRKAAAESLLKECAAVALAEPAQLDAWRSRLDALAQAQPGLPSWLAAHVAAKRLDELLPDIERRIVELSAEGERLRTCEQFIAESVASRRDDAESVAVAAAAWAALLKPENATTRLSLESRWQALQPPPAAVPAPAEPVPRPAPPPRPAKIDRVAVLERLEKLERAVEEGHLVDAEAAAKAVETALGGNSLRGELESRWQRANAQLGELRGWARWGTGQARDNLIAAAEQLLNGEPDVDALAQAVQDLREKWKQLNTFGPAAKSQWERFDAAAKKAYEPVAARHEEEVARQAAARDVKAAMCAEWEASFAGIVWEHADYKVLEVQRQEMLERWRAAAPAGFRDERALRKRFDKLVKGFDERLDAMRAAELERREQLIAAAEALRDVTDLGRAMTEAKALQERWTRQAIPLRLKRSVEQKLWQRFRAACGDVFARRDAQRVQHVAQREERTQALRNMLDAFEASLADNDAGAIKRAASRFRTEWEAAKANPRDAANGLDGRARDLQQQAQQRIDTLLQGKRSAHFALLAQKAALAAGVEAVAAAGEPTEAAIAAAKQAWDALPRLPGKTENALAARLAKASGATAKALACGRETCATMLLDLEIALGLSSPAAYVEARRKRQLERLQNRFGGDSSQPADAEALLVQWYATAAAPDAALDQRVAAVTHKLLLRAE